ncbi:TonB-dependent receptor [soil metagenome]
MSKKKLMFLLCVLANGFTTQAQSDSTALRTFDEIIITANKLPQKQSTTGKVVTVINKEIIERSAGKSLSQLLNEQAGITINGALNNTGANQTLYVRGASAGRTLVLIDGVPAYDPSFITSEFDLNLLSLSNVERIEISRGAQSTLYGSDAVAGVVNIITTKNKITKPINFKATATAGSFDTYKGNIQLFGKIGKFFYNTGYAGIKSKGFSAAYDSTGSKNFDNDGFISNNLNASANYQLSNNLLIRTFIKQNNYTTDLDAGLFADEKDYTSKSKMLMTGGGMDYKHESIQITANYQYSNNTRKYINDSIDIPTFIKYSTDRYNSISQFLEIFSSVGINKIFTLLQGADHRYSSMNNDYFSISSFGPYSSSFNDTSHSQSSLYASLLFSDNKKKLNIEAGGRLNVHSRYGSNSTYTFNPSYNINDALRIFGSIASGYKAPTLYQLYSAYGNLNLKPETSVTKEIGIQQRSTITSNRIVYFHRDIEQGIDFDYNNFSYFNINKQVVQGIETESRITIKKGLNIILNYTFLAAKENSQSRVSFKDSTYKYLLRRPKHNINITASYLIKDKFFISASGKFVSNRFDSGGYQEDDILLEKYFLLSSYAEFKFNKHFKIFTDAQNITNKKFFDIKGYNSIPFIMSAGVSVEW